VLGAFRAGIRRVLVPSRNNHDIAELALPLRSQIEVIYIETLAAALEYALCPIAEKEEKTVRRTITRPPRTFEDD
jgi:predicted ATP-dependent protease